MIDNLIRVERKKAGLTQQQLADLAGVQRNTITRIENGRFPVRADLLERIADALGKEIGFFDKLE